LADSLVLQPEVSNPPSEPILPVRAKFCENAAVVDISAVSGGARNLLEKKARKEAEPQAASARSCQIKVKVENITVLSCSHNLVVKTKVLMKLKVDRTPQGFDNGFYVNYFSSSNQ
jgi:hypothetical protein